MFDTFEFQDDQIIRDQVNAITAIQIDTFVDCGKGVPVVETEYCEGSVRGIHILHTPIPEGRDRGRAELRWQHQ
jgi:hypothetical protein